MIFLDSNIALSYLFLTFLEWAYLTSNTICYLSYEKVIIEKNDEMALKNPGKMRYNHLDDQLGRGVH